MSDTRRKLEEARFFFSKLEEDVADAAFCYYLSAFISAARSVTWVMKAENRGNPHWVAWYEGRWPTLSEQEMFRRTNALRVRAVKRQTPAASGIVVVTPEPGAFTDELQAYFGPERVGERFTVTLAPSDEPHPTVVEDGRVSFICTADAYPVVDEFPDENVVDACRKYLQRLEALVDESDRSLSPPGGS